MLGTPALRSGSTSTRTSSMTPATRATSGPAWPLAHSPACSSPRQPRPARRSTNSDDGRIRTDAGAGQDPHRTAGHRPRRAPRRRRRDDCFVAEAITSCLRAGVIAYAARPAGYRCRRFSFWRSAWRERAALAGLFGWCARRSAEAECGEPTGGLEAFAVRFWTPIWSRPPANRGGA